MPSVKSTTSYSSRFAPYEGPVGGEAPHPPSAEPELGAEMAWNFYWEDPVIEEEVPYMAEEDRVEYDAYDYHLDLPPLFEEMLPQSDREGANSPRNSTESADSMDRNDLEDPLDEPALGDEEVVEEDGEFEMNFDGSDDEDYIYEGPGGPQSPPPPLLYFGCEEAGSPDTCAITVAVREALRRVTRRLEFH